jgi:hypothetical protein
VYDTVVNNTWVDDSFFSTGYETRADAENAIKEYFLDLVQDDYGEICHLVSAPSFIIVEKYGWES